MNRRALFATAIGAGMAAIAKPSAAREKDFDVRGNRRYIEPAIQPASPRNRKDFESLPPGGHRTAETAVFTGSIYDSIEPKTWEFTNEKMVLCAGISRELISSEDELPSPRSVEDAWIRPDGRWVVLVWMPERWADNLLPNW